ncbi:MAG TPA: thioredoxin family protein [Candidatus Polarisedimenticolia bacterium]|nr:thioredoxin family protein [Candidatus Polarisedimenticolia bacterium]
MSAVRLTAAAAMAWALAACSAAGPEDPAGQAERRGGAGAGSASAPESRPQAVPASQPAPAAEEGMWYPRFDWSLEVDGKPADEARFFVDREQRKVLVHAPGLAKAAVLDLPTKKVTPVDRAEVALDAASDLARMRPGAEAGAPGADYTVQGAQVIFYLGGNRLKITPKQPLEGQATEDAILRHSPLYRKGKTDYSPSPADVARIKAVDKEVRIEVFFGTWCPHCKVLVPKFMRTMEDADNRRITVAYHGVPRNFGEYGPARSKGVTGVPTFIFTQGDREVGRIPGEPEGPIEQAVARILASPS